jgi:hypothetical protein
MTSGYNLRLPCYIILKKLSFLKFDGRVSAKLHMFLLATTSPNTILFLAEGL